MGYLTLFNRSLLTIDDIGVFLTACHISQVCPSIGAFLRRIKYYITQQYHFSALKIRLNSSLGEHQVGEQRALLRASWAQRIPQEQDAAICKGSVT